MTELLTFFTSPRSRGQIVRWMLEEVGAPYETVLLDYGTTMKGADYLAINAMGKVPAIKHGDAIVTEASAICAYLADAFPQAGLAPALADRADYYRWMFFAAGPLDAAFSNKALDWEAPPERRGMLGYGTFDLAIAAVGSFLDGKAYVACGKFSAADVIVGSILDFMINFKLLEPSTIITQYLSPLRERPAYQRAQEIDAALVPPPT